MPEKTQLEFEKELLAKMESMPNRAGKHRMVASQKLKIQKLESRAKSKAKSKRKTKDKKEQEPPVTTKEFLDESASGQE